MRSNWKNLESLLRPSIGAAILEVEYDTRTAIMQQVRLEILAYAGKILSPAHATSAIRAASLAALRACLIGAYSEYETFNDVYTSILSQAVIRVELIDDEKSSLSRPLGELAYALVLSCFLEVLQQLRDSNRSLLPFRPVSSMLAGANRQ